MYCDIFSFSLARSARHFFVFNFFFDEKFRGKMLISRGRMKDDINLHNRVLRKTFCSRSLEREASRA